MTYPVEKILDVNGSTIDLTGGSFKTSSSPVTDILYRLFGADWVGNMFVEPEQRMESGFQDAHSTTMTRNTLMNIAGIAEKRLKRLVDTGVFSGIKAATRLTESGVIETQIAFTYPDERVRMLKVRKYLQYWKIEGDLDGTYSSGVR